MSEQDWQNIKQKMKILGIDFGKKKVGLAWAETNTGLSEPLGVFPILTFFQLLQGNKVGLNLEEVDKIIIGKTGGKIDKEIEKFAEEVKKLSSKPIFFYDETLTSQEAQKNLIMAGVGKKKRKKKEDALSAALMLQYYLESKG